MYCSDVPQPEVGSVQAFLNLQVSKSGKLILNEKTTMTSAPKTDFVKNRLVDFKKVVNTKTPKFWDNVLAGYTVSAVEEELFDEIPELPPLDCETGVLTNKHTPRGVQTPSNMHTPSNIPRNMDTPRNILTHKNMHTPTNMHTPRNMQTPKNLQTNRNSMRKKSDNLVPLFSGDVSLPGCSDGAKADYQTPIRKKDYNDIFQLD